MFFSAFSFRFNVGMCVYSITTKKEKNWWIWNGKRLQKEIKKHWNSKHDYKRRKRKKSQSASTHRHTSFDNNNNRLNHEWNGKMLIKVGDCIKINFVVEIGIGFWTYVYRTLNRKLWAIARNYSSVAAATTAASTHLH